MSDPEFLGNVGPSIARALDKAGRSQASVARDIDLSKDGLSRIVRGARRNPKLSSVWLLADAAGTSIDELVGRTKPAAS